MIWVGWRQQRTETLIAAGMLVLLAVVLVPTGLQMASAYDHDGLAACVAAGASDACQQAIAAFTGASSSSPPDRLVHARPRADRRAACGAVHPQLEHGTYRLDWTQSITRGRWIAGKLGLAIGAGCYSAAFTLLITWWRAPFVHLQGRMENSVFDSEGIVVFGYTLFALGLAAAVGAVWRRAVPRWSSPSPATSPRGCSSTRGCGSG